MTVRLGIDLEPLAALARLWKDMPLDILDFAYAAGAAGAQMILAPEETLERSDLMLLARPGLPLFVLKVREKEFERVMQLPLPADRYFIVGDYGSAFRDVDDFNKFRREVSDTSTLGALVEAEPGSVKKAAQAGMVWVVFSTTPYVQAATPKGAEDELARLSTAVFTAEKFGLRVAVMGPMYPHLLRPLLEIEGIEEIYPGAEIWLRALRVGWERALEEYTRILERA